jgi:hypothetical protein
MIDVSKLTAVPREQLLLTMSRTGTNGPTSAYVDRSNGWCIQIDENSTPGCDGTPWEGTIRVAVKHTKAKTPAQAMRRGYDLPVTWDDMQAIKDHFWEERIAVEVFPPKDKIVDVADMRWMWVLPKGTVLPFNLQSSSIERLES